VEEMTLHNTELIRPFTFRWRGEFRQIEWNLLSQIVSVRSSCIYVCVWDKWFEDSR